MNKALIDLAEKIKNKRWFGRRHYEAIADTLYYAVKNENGCDGVEYAFVCDHLATLFSEDNPLFNPYKFMSRCGVDIWDKRMINVPDDVRKVMFSEGIENVTNNEMEIEYA